MAEHDLDAQIGIALHRIRREAGLTVTELGKKAGVSSAMISRIENGQVSPSLTTLGSLAQGLQVELMSLFAHTSESADIHYVPDAAGLVSKRISPGHAHDYALLGKHVSHGAIFESVRVTIHRDQSTDLPRYQHEGFVFLHMVEGKATYACGGQEFPLKAGASLSFDGKLPHGLLKIVSDKIVMISVSSKPV